MKSVIVIDDDSVLLDTYEYFFKSFDDYQLKGIFQNANEALEEFESLYPDIIISDISMPGIGGIKAAFKFKALDPEVKIIIVSVHDDLSYIINSFKNNVDGYLTKPIDKNSLLGALKSLENNGSPLSGNVSRQLINLFKKEKNEMFSDRENEILSLFSQGHTYKTIAEKLFITPSTVNFHIQNIYTKLNVNCKSDALKVLRTEKKFIF